MAIFDFIMIVLAAGFVASTILGMQIRRNSKKLLKVMLEKSELFDEYKPFLLQYADKNLVYLLVGFVLKLAFYYWFFGLLSLNEKTAIMVPIAETQEVLKKLKEGTVRKDVTVDFLSVMREYEIKCSLGMLFGFSGTYTEEQTKKVNDIRNEMGEYTK